jgi:DinB family protein
LLQVRVGIVPFGGSVAIGDLLPRLAAAAQRLAGLRPAVQAKIPWPLSTNFGTEPEASWGPPETLAHVAEMLPFWLGEIERIVDGRADPVPFGRVATDQLRLLVLERDRSLPPRELFDRIETGAERVARRLATLRPSDAARLGLHPRLGQMTVEAVAERFVVAHLEEHADQLAAVVRSAVDERGARAT